MSIKLIGAALVAIGCTGFGYIVASSVKKECTTLRQFIVALEYIICEIEYRRTPLPELFRLASSVCTGALCRFFLTTAKVLEKQTIPDAKKSVELALKKHIDIPRYTVNCIMLLGDTLGVFDMTGQMKSLQSVKAEAERLLAISNENLSCKTRCYKTLGISAGIALVIIFI